MTGSSMPLDAHLGSHPVHRATALLRQALYSPTPPTPHPAEIWDTPLRLDPALVDLIQESVSATTPEVSSDLECQPLECQPPITDSNDGSAAQTFSENEGEGEDVLDRAVQLQLQGLVQAFHERQRQANLLVACSVAAAVILTLGGLLLLFGTAGPATGESEATSKEGTSKDGPSVTLAVHRAELAPPFVRPMRVVVNKDAKDAPLLVRAKAEANAASSSMTTPNTQILNAQPNRPLELSPLLPLGSARYMLLRGLPDDAELSAGRRTGAGTWMVKGEDVDDLTLTLGSNANGDYPMEVYLLGTKDGPQARRRLVLRVDAEPQLYGAGFDLGWPIALSNATLPKAAQEPAAEPDAVSASPRAIEALHEKAHLLLGNGNIAEAQLLLTELAEHGVPEAAYELALTYDREVLSKAGLNDVDGDMQTARAWYERAAQAGHTDAAKRLQMLAKSRAGA